MWIGKVNASSCTQILIDRFNVTEIINTGIAGSLNKKVKLCDIVISDNVTYHDVRQAQMKNHFPFKEFFTTNEQLRELAIKAYENNVPQNYDYHIGRIVTGDTFVCDDDLKKKIITNYNPYCVEMEGAAIGHVAEINKIPFIIIRSISDNADKEASINYKEFEGIASNNSAMLVLGMLELISRLSWYKRFSSYLHKLCIILGLYGVISIGRKPLYVFTPLNMSSTYFQQVIIIFGDNNNSW